MATTAEAKCDNCGGTGSLGSDDEYGCMALVPCLFCNPTKESIDGKK